MLKRSDLAKQFELVVQQEIKNFNDSLNGILQSIRDLGSDISCSKDECLENYSLLHSKQSEQESRLHQLQIFVEDNLKRHQSLINDLTKSSQAASTEIERLSNANLEIIRKISDYPIKFSMIDQRLEAMESKIERNADLIDDSFKILEDDLSHEFAEFRKEMLIKPSELDSLKAELGQKIDTHVVDVAGLMRELRALRKDMMIEGKKIEAIFMLLDKMKKEASP
jgi:predicted  nucleic acid-binding Zn-ribbon protein